MIFNDYIPQKTVSLPDDYLIPLNNISELNKVYWKKIIDSAKNIPVVSNNRFKLFFTDIKLEGPDSISATEAKKAVLNNKSLYRKLTAVANLEDVKTGNLIDQKKITLAAIPYFTPHGTFVINGVEYTLANQMRLKPGVYHRQKESGEYEAHFNPLPGQGVSFRVELNPASGKFNIVVEQASIPAYTFFKILGITDEQMSTTWGNDIYKLNIIPEYKEEAVINRLFEKFVRKSPRSYSTEAKIQAIRQAVYSLKMDPETVNFVLQRRDTHITPDLVLASTKKLLDISRGLQTTDDRDSLVFQLLMDPSDLISERISNADRLLKQLLWKITYKQSLKPLSSGFLNKHVIAAIFDSGLGQPLEEVNPADILDQVTRISRLGTGSIASTENIPSEARSVQPSHFGFIDPVRTPESLKAGVDLRIASGAKKGLRNNFYIPVLEVKTNRLVWQTPLKLFDKKLTTIDQLNSNSENIFGFYRGNIEIFPKDQIDYVFPFGEYSFNHLSNLVPLKSAIKGQRLAMGSRYIAQSVPLVKPESPLVQTALPENPRLSFYKIYSPFFAAIYSDSDGTVVKVSEDQIIVEDKNKNKKIYNLYNEYPLNRKTFIHNTPVVSVGTKVTKGQLLAKSNFTNDLGEIAVGINAKVAYLPFGGANYEDSIAISESFAKKLASEHMFQELVETSTDVKVGKDQYLAIFGGTFTNEQLKNIDEDGVVKPGTILKYGDPVILSIRHRPLTHKLLFAGKKARFIDNSVKWENDAEGVVVDVIKSKKFVLVTIKSIFPVKPGDKLSGFYGDKGVIAAIIPDDLMPRDENDKPFDALLNPAVIITRRNPAQIYEAALGKIASAKNFKYLIDDFSKTIYRNDEIINYQSLPDFVINEGKKYGIKFYENVTDPVTGKVIPRIFTGVKYLMKLYHLAELKESGRSFGEYTAEGLPAKGGEEGSKKFAPQDVHVLLAHGATEVIRDAKLIRGQMNPEFWSIYISGHAPPVPKIPLVYDKFLHELKGLGANVVRSNYRTFVFPLSDSEIKKLVGERYLRNTETVDWKHNLEPISGGLFDYELTGGHSGVIWSGIKLEEPVINPIALPMVMSLLRLTEQQVIDLYVGKLSINGKTGPEGLKKLLSEINPKSELEGLKSKLSSVRRSDFDAELRRFSYLWTLYRYNIKPEELMWSVIPVIPPKFRPISLLAESETQIVHDYNYLYKEVFTANEALKELKNKVDDLSNERLTLFNAVQGLVGLSDPIHPKNKARQVKGILSHIFGSSPKFSTVLQKLVGSTVDLTGRAVVVPDMNLDIDEIGIPVEMAWEIYKPFVMRRLVRRGLPRYRAIEETEQRTELAKNELLNEMSERPVIVNRSPLLHKYGELAFWPKLTYDNVIHVSPPVVKGFNMDFDGDSVVDTFVFIKDGNNHISCELISDFVSRIDPTFSEKKFLSSDKNLLIIDLSHHRFFIPGPTVSGNKLIWKKIKAIQVKKYHGELFTVETTSGRLESFTDNHNLAIFKNNKIVAVPSKSIIRGLSIPLLFRLPNFDENVDSFCLDFLKEPAPIDEIVQFLGIVLSNLKVSHIHKNYVEILIPTKYQSDIVLNFISRYFKINTTIIDLTTKTIPRLSGLAVRSTYYKFVIRNKEFINFLLTLINNNGNYLSFPNEIYNLPLKYKIKFLLSFCYDKLLYNDHGISLHQRFYEKSAIPSFYALLTSMGIPFYGNFGSLISNVLFRKRRYYATILPVSDANTKSDFINDFLFKILKDYQIRYDLISKFKANVKDDFLIDIIHVVDKTKLDNPIITYDFELDLQSPEENNLYALASGIIIHNTSTVHVPVSEEAVKEAIIKMLPSRNLISAATFKPDLYVPLREFAGGLYAATAFKRSTPRPKEFKNSKEVINAFLKGQLDLDEEVIVSDLR